MPDPIPDAVLRDIAEYGLAAGRGPNDHVDIARELLALREAAKRVAGWTTAVVGPYGCRCGWQLSGEHGALAMSESWARHAAECPLEALHALLHKEAP